MKTDALSKEEKAKELEKITQEIEACAICKHEKSGKAVPGEGNANADIVFIGEAPGKTEAKTGRPFIGRSGKLLRTLIRNIGLLEEDVFITSPVKYLPDRGTPTKKDIMHGRIHFQKQLDIIDPKIIILLGSVAVQGVLEIKIPVLKQHGQTVEKNGKLYLFTIHPAAALRFPKLGKILENDFKKAKELVKKMKKNVSE